MHKMNHTVKQVLRVLKNINEPPLIWKSCYDKHCKFHLVLSVLGIDNTFFNTNNIYQLEKKSPS